MPTIPTAAPPAAPPSALDDARTRDYVRAFLARAQVPGQTVPGGAVANLRHWMEEIDGKVNAQVEEIVTHPEFLELQESWRCEYEQAIKSGPAATVALKMRLARTVPRLSLKVPCRLTGEDMKLAVELRFERFEDFIPFRLAERVPQLRDQLDVRFRLFALLQKLLTDEPFGLALDAALHDPALARELARGLDQASTPSPAVDPQPEVTPAEPPAAKDEEDMPEYKNVAPSEEPTAERAAPPRRGSGLLASALAATGLVALGTAAAITLLPDLVPGFEQPHLLFGAAALLFAGALAFVLYQPKSAPVPAPKPAREEAEEEWGDLDEALAAHPPTPPAPPRAEDPLLTVAGQRPTDLLARLADAARAAQQDSAHREAQKTPTDALLRCLKGHAGAVHAVAFLPDGYSALSGGADGSVRLWYLATGREADCLKEHAGAVTGLAVGDDGRLAASTGADGTALWDLSAGDLVRRCDGVRVAFAANGKMLLTAGADGLRLWDAATGKQTAVIECDSRCPSAIALSADGAWAVSGMEEGGIQKWDLAKHGATGRFVGHTGAVASLVLARDGKRCVSGGDSTVRLWDAATGKELRCFTGHAGPVRSVTLTPDGKRVLSGGDDGTVRLWEVETGRELTGFTGHEGAVLAVAVAPNGRRALSGGDDGTVRLWQMPE